MMFNLIKRAKHLLFKSGRISASNTQDAIDGIGVDISDTRAYLGLSKNMLNHTVTSQVKNGVTITVNEDRSITLNGTATSELRITLAGDYNNPIYDYSKAYIISGTPEGSSLSTYCIRAQRKYSNGSIYAMFVSPEGYKTEIETASNTGVVLLEIYVASGVRLDNVTFYPMVREASEVSGNYEPYTVGGRLIELENEINSNIETKSRWNWFGDFYGTDGISVASVKGKAREFLIRSVFAGSTGGADVVIENHIINNEYGAEPIAVNSYFYSTAYYACIAHQYDYNNATINLYPSWTTLVGTQNEMASIFSRVYYR